MANLKPETKLVRNFSDLTKEEISTAYVLFETFRQDDTYKPVGSAALDECAVMLGVFDETMDDKMTASEFVEHAQTLGFTEERHAA